MTEADDSGGELLHALQEGLGDHSIAARVVAFLQRHFGGREIYVPAPGVTARDAEIRRRYNGRNRIEICHEFGISKTTLYRIVGRR